MEESGRVKRRHSGYMFEPTFELMSTKSFVSFRSLADALLTQTDRTKWCIDKIPSFLLGATAHILQGDTEAYE